MKFAVADLEQNFNIKSLDHVLSLSVVLIYKYR